MSLEDKHTTSLENVARLQKLADRHSEAIKRIAAPAMEAHSNFLKQAQPVLGMQERMRKQLKPLTDMQERIAKQLLPLHAAGLGNRAMAKQLQVHHSVVGNLLKTLELPSNNPRGTPPREVEPGLFECKSCLEPKPREDFSLVRSTSDGRRLSTCKACNSAKAQEKLKDPEVYWSDRQKRIFNRTKGMTPATNLPNGFLFDLWSKQGGRCFYTDELVNISIGEGLQRNSPSVDKLVPDDGYTVGNVVICTHKANSIKQDLTLDEIKEWLPGWYKRISNFLEGDF